MVDSGNDPISLTDKPKVNFARELLAGLTVSFVAISLGAAFGVMSERGALAGILSAGVISLITAAFGGTRIQCSGPTAPMTAVTAVLIARIADGYLKDVPDANADQFLNMVLILTGLFLVMAALFRLGKLIKLVPRVVISGFMNGIAVLIWVGEINSLFGLGGKQVMAGGLIQNLAVMLITLWLCFAAPTALRRFHPFLSSFFPATLLAIVLVSGAVFLFGIDVERVAVGGTLDHFSDVTALVQQQFPTNWSSQLLMLALPFAAQLAMLAYLDTLLTSLVVDKKVQALFGTNETTALNRELAAQGVANATVATFGGIPGAQATIRSVLILNEGAMTRLAGVMVGVFVLIEMLTFQDLIGMIPKAVFSGVLIKVGYDVFDWQPVKVYWKELTQGAVPSELEANTKLAAGADTNFGVDVMTAEIGDTTESLSNQPVVKKRVRASVTHLNMLFIFGTTIVTVLVNLNIAVIAFCASYYLLRLFVPVHDLVDSSETEGMGDES